MGAQAVEQGENFLARSGRVRLVAESLMLLSWACAEFVFICEVNRKARVNNIEAAST